MPALKGIEIKTLFGKTVDKENDSVFFNDAEHLYLDKLSGEKYISATQLIHNYSNPFNSAFFSKYKALEANFNPIVESMEIYIRFLKKTIEDYKALDKELMQKAEEYNEQLKVNS